MMVNYKDKILTIIVCCYNAAEFLDECLGSLVKQSASALFYKVLFVNDASTDGSPKIAMVYSKKLRNIAFLNNEKKEGLVNCCNEVLEAIDTPYFMRLDADDYLSPNALNKVLMELNSSNEIDFIVFKRWDIRGGEFEEADVVNDIYSWIAAGTVFNTEAVKAVGGYSNEYWEEYDLYVKLLEAGSKYKVSSHYIYYYRRGHESMTKNYKEQKRGFERLIKKWGLETLRKYGNIEKALEYYGVKKVGGLECLR